MSTACVAAATAIEVIDVSFAYGKVRVFSEVNFAVPRGEVWGLVGRSGVGKTTLLNVILGLYRPQAGTVRVDGELITGPGQIRGVVFQEESLFWWRTVLGNVMVRGRKVLGRVEKSSARELIKMAGLQGYEARYPSTLSVGMRRRVELARALFIDDRFFIGDEPFASVDAQTKFDLYSAFRSLRTALPRTGILCTHDPLEAAILCDAVIVIRRVRDGAAEAVNLRVPIRFKESGGREIAYRDPFLADLVKMIAS